MAKEVENVVTLIIKGQDIRFNPTYNDYNKFINEMQMNNKVSPANNYIMRIVAKESKETLVDILVSNPGAALQIAGAVNDEFAPELEITVKK
ncbi:putative phage tail assembly chaperone [Limnobaculum xujianqingii]|uniref:putative phage tail assembly chaperone n=1 Tax=Limnobaculum xujianqingii TaxID=2738837 RepID=UPI00112E6DEB|nr:putative phage tail assembly chaperone [Limnobaculum xujianqingii]